MRLINPYLFAIISVLLCSFNSHSGQWVAGESIQLFNGNNFDGWHLVYRHSDMDKNLFTINEGVIHAYRDQIENSEQTFAGLISDQEYSNYILQVEYKWGMKKFLPRELFVRDAGVIFHMFGEETIWPNGIEMQIQEGDTGDMWVIGAKATSKVSPIIKNYQPDGHLVTRGSISDKFNRFHRGYSWEKPGWNKMKIIVKGDSAKFILNEKVVNEAIDIKYYDEKTKQWRPLTKGKILLQAEGSEVYYRNVILTPLFLTE